MTRPDDRARALNRHGQFWPFPAHSGTGLPCQVALVTTLDSRGSLVWKTTSGKVGLNWLNPVYSCKWMQTHRRGNPYVEAVGPDRHRNPDELIAGVERGLAQSVEFTTHHQCC